MVRIGNTTTMTKRTFTKNSDRACAVKITCPDNNCDSAKLVFHNSPYITQGSITTISYKEFLSMTNNMGISPTCQNLDSVLHEEDFPDDHVLWGMKNGSKCNLQSVETPDNMNVEFFSGGGGNWDFPMCNEQRLRLKSFVEECGPNDFKTGFCQNHPG